MILHKVRALWTSMWVTAGSQSKNQRNRLQKWGRFCLVLCYLWISGTDLQLLSCCAQGLLAPVTGWNGTVFVTRTPPMACSSGSTFCLFFFLFIHYDPHSCSSCMTLSMLVHPVIHFTYTVVHITKVSEMSLSEETFERVSSLIIWTSKTIIPRTEWEFEIMQGLLFW